MGGGEYVKKERKEKGREVCWEAGEGGRTWRWWLLDRKRQALGKLLLTRPAGQRGRCVPQLKQNKTIYTYIFLDGGQQRRIQIVAAWKGLLHREAWEQAFSLATTLGTSTSFVTGTPAGCSI